MNGLLLAAALAAGAAQGRPPLMVAAAASLSDVLPRAASAWERAGGGQVRFAFDASSRLARQIRAGAPVDAFVSADERWMDALEEDGRLAPGSRALVARNRLVVATRAAGPALGDAKDLAGESFAHVALAGENVPAGRYAKAALRSLGLWDAVEPKAVRAEHSRVALRWVALGEAEAGIVYATDAAIEPRVRTAFVFPEKSHPPIAYPAAVLARSERAAEAAAFLGFLRGPRGRAVLAESGFLAP